MGDARALSSDAARAQGAHILIVDDTPANLDILCGALECAGHTVSEAQSGELATEIAREACPDLILLDVMMPGMDGYATCLRLKQMEGTSSIPVIFLTVRGETDGIVEGFRAGGVDYIVKPFRIDEVLARVETHLKISRLTCLLSERNRALEEAIAQRDSLGAERNHLANRLDTISRDEARRWGIKDFVGKSPTVRGILEEIGLLQDAGMVRVLITGESGTGKELVARAIHCGSPRGRGPFVPVNCAAVPAELAESLFFGSTRGAFTGAERDRPGYFDLARGGTLFLDEVGDMPLGIQPKLLRVLEEEVVVPLGGAHEKRLDVRVLASTNQDLPARLATGAFRRDLFFRLAQFTVALPPLRERPEDIPHLAEHFLRIFAEEMARPAPLLTEGALRVLRSYSFPGNVRELKNIIERALLKSRGAAIGPEHLSLIAGGLWVGGHSEMAAVAAGVSPPQEELPFDLEQVELLAIRRALAHTQGNVTEAAQVLRTSRSRIYRALEKHSGSR